MHIICVALLGVGYTRGQSCVVIDIEYCSVQHKKKMLCSFFVVLTYGCIDSYQRSLR